MCAMSLLLWLFSSGSLAVWCTGRTQSAPLLSVEAVVVIWRVRPKPFGGGWPRWIICVHNLYCVMNSVKTVPIECTQEGGHTHTRTHTRTHARTHLVCACAIRLFMGWRHCFLTKQASLQARDKSPKWTRLFSPAFHRVRTSTLGRFTLSMAESSCISLYATCGVTFARSLDTPVFLWLHWLAHRFLTDFNFLGVKYWQSLTHAAVHTSVSCATTWMEI